MPEIINVPDNPGGLSSAVQYFHSKWGNANNYEFYYDAIAHSSQSPISLPRFYLLYEEDQIIGSYALLINDIISRQDLYPWFACLYIEANHRAKGYGKLLMQHACEETKRLGYKELYLATDHKDYYERYAWLWKADGFEPSGDKFRIYHKELSNEV